MFEGHETVAGYIKKYEKESNLEKKCNNLETYVIDAIMSIKIIGCNLSPGER